jgi:hypothetical protein
MSLIVDGGPETLKTPQRAASFRGRKTSSGGIVSIYEVFAIEPGPKSDECRARQTTDQTRDIARISDPVHGRKAKDRKFGGTVGHSLRRAKFGAPFTHRIRSFRGTISCLIESGSIGPAIYRHRTDQNYVRNASIEGGFHKIICTHFVCERKSVNIPCSAAKCVG